MMIFFLQIFTLSFLCNCIFVLVQQCKQFMFYTIMSLQTVHVLLGELDKPGCYPNVNLHDILAGLSGSVGCAVRLETRRSRVQPPPRSATFFRGD